MTFCILGGDTRMRMLEKLLADDGNNVQSFGAGGKEIPKNADFSGKTVILPLPAFKSGFLNGNTGYDKESIRAMTESADAVFGGMSDEKWLRDYYKREELVIKNAHITAECAVSLVQNELLSPVCGKKILIIGFGRIGKELSRLLRAMGADISVSARRAEHKAMIEAMGCRALNTNRLSGSTSDFDVIINTVPERVVFAETIDETKASCLFIELASEPYGIDGEYAKNVRRYVLASGLPGKMMPLGAAEAIRDTIYNMLEESNG